MKKIIIGCGLIVFVVLMIISFCRDFAVQDNFEEHNVHIKSGEYDVFCVYCESDMLSMSAVAGEVNYWGAKTYNQNAEKNEENYVLLDSNSILGNAKKKKYTPEVLDFEGYISPEPQTVQKKRGKWLIVDYYYLKVE